jgi:hypothetical protein
MRAATLAAGIQLAVSFVIPTYAGPGEPAAMPATPKKRKAVQAAKPTWEQCYAMSRQRGFDHDLEEWLQSIQDCMEGKIPL